MTIVSPSEPAETIKALADFARRYQDLMLEAMRLNSEHLAPFMEQVARLDAEVHAMFADCDDVAPAAGRWRLEQQLDEMGLHGC